MSNISKGKYVLPLLSPLSNGSVCDSEKCVCFDCPNIRIKLTLLESTRKILNCNKTRKKGFFSVSHKNIVNVKPKVYNLLFIPRARPYHPLCVNPNFSSWWCIVIFIVHCFTYGKNSKTMSFTNTILLVSVRITNILGNGNYWFPFSCRWS